MRVARETRRLIQLAVATTLDGGLSALLRGAGRKGRHWLGRVYPGAVGQPRGPRLAGISDYVEALYGDESPEYEPPMETPLGGGSSRVIAFYLPQFHPIEENDRWWGRGFTEWTNVTRARPRFAGHYQPRLPADLGFYDLRVTDVLRRQVQMARTFGIHGFCFHYYWFKGRRLLYKPLQQVLDDPTLDVPFCICWANESWTRRWDGSEHEVLLAQEHSPETDFAFIQDAEHILRDPRYITINGRPVVIVYRADLLPDASATAERWRRYCVDRGLGNPFLMAAQTFELEDPRPYGFDAAVEFPPHRFRGPSITHEVDLLHAGFNGWVVRYADAVHAASQVDDTEYPLFRTVMPCWDNTARRGNAASVFHGSTPRLYRRWLESSLRYTSERHSPEAQLVFVNAWNEWAEGAHLEPDRRYGFAYLNATNCALRSHSTRSRAPSPAPRVSVVVPAYNHESYVVQALQSVTPSSERIAIEMIVVDDGSTDRTARLAESFAARAAFPVRIIRQPNGGVPSALNRGIEAARGEYIAILNSDDLFGADRIERLIMALESSTSARLAFSDIDIIDARGVPIAEGHAYADHLRGKLDAIGSFPKIGYALLDSNVAVTTGNLFFRRELFDLVGGFRDLAYCHDWDFILTALRYTDPVFVPQRLYSYRLHRANTYARLQSVAAEETEAVLRRFFACERDSAVVRSGFPSRRTDGVYFDQFVRSRYYEIYYPDAVPQPASVPSVELESTDA